MGACASLASSQGEDKSLALYGRDPFMLYEAWNFPIGTSVTVASRGIESMMAYTIGEDMRATITTIVTENDKSGIIMERAMVTNGKKTREAVIEIPRAQPHDLGAEVLQIGDDVMECQVSAQVMRNGNTRTTWDSWGHPLPLQIRTETTNPATGTSETILATALTAETTPAEIYGTKVNLYPYSWSVMSPTGGRVRAAIETRKHPTRREIQVNVTIKDARELPVEIQNELGPNCVIKVQVGAELKFTDPTTTCEAPVWNQEFIFVLTPGLGIPDLKLSIVPNQASILAQAESTFTLRTLRLEKSTVEKWLPLNSLEEHTGSSTLWAAPEIPGWGGILLPNNFDVEETYNQAGDPEWRDSIEDQLLGNSYQLLTSVKRVQKAVIKKPQDPLAKHRGNVDPQLDPTGQPGAWFQGSPEDRQNFNAVSGIRS